jgi:hypothetical protein
MAQKGRYGVDAATPAGDFYTDKRPITSRRLTGHAVEPTLRAPGVHGTPGTRPKGMSRPLEAAPSGSWPLRVRSAALVKPGGAGS